MDRQEIGIASNPIRDRRLLNEAFDLSAQARLPVAVVVDAIRREQSWTSNKQARDETNLITKLMVMGFLPQVWLLADQTPELLRSKLKNVAGVFVAGGNTHELAKACQKVAFGPIVGEALPNIFCMGYSAGGILMGQLEATADWLVLPDKHYDSAAKNEVLPAFGWLPVAIVVHVMDWLERTRRNPIADRAAKQPFPVVGITQQSVAFAKTTPLDQPFEIFSHGSVRVYNDPTDLVKTVAI